MKKKMMDEIRVNKINSYNADNKLWSTWLITYETNSEVVINKRVLKTKLFSFDSKLPTVSGLKGYFSESDVILFMQRLDRN